MTQEEVKHISFGITKGNSYSFGTATANAVFRINPREEIITTSREIIRVDSGVIVNRAPHKSCTGVYCPIYDALVTITTVRSVFNVFLLNYDIREPVLTDISLDQIGICHVLFDERNSTIVTFGNGIKTWYLDCLPKSARHVISDNTADIRPRASFAHHYTAFMMVIPCLDTYNHRIFVPTQDGLLCYDYDGKFLPPPLQHNNHWFTMFTFNPYNKKMLTSDRDEAKESKAARAAQFKKQIVTQGVQYWREDGSLSKELTFTNSSLFAAFFVDKEFAVTVDAAFYVHIIDMKTMKFFTCCQIEVRPNHIFFQNDEKNMNLVICSSNSVFYYKICLPWRLWLLTHIPPTMIQRCPRYESAARIAVQFIDSSVRLFTPYSILLTLCHSASPASPTSVVIDRGIPEENDRDQIYVVLENGVVQTFGANECPCLPSTSMNLKAHSCCIAEVFEQRCILFGTKVGDILMYDYTSIKFVRRIICCEGEILFLFYHAPSKSLFALTDYKMFRVSTETGKVTENYYQKCHKCAALYDDLLIVGYENGSYLIERVNDNEGDISVLHKSTHPLHTGRVVGLAHGSNYFVSAGFDGTILVWDMHATVLVMLSFPSPIYSVGIHNGLRGILIGTDTEIMYVDGKILFNGTVDPEDEKYDNYDKKRDYLLCFNKGNKFEEEEDWLNEQNPNSSKRRRRRRKGGKKDGDSEYDIDVGPGSSHGRGRKSQYAAMMERMKKEKEKEEEEKKRKQEEEEQAEAQQQEEEELNEDEEEQQIEEDFNEVDGTKRFKRKVRRKNDKGEYEEEYEYVDEKGNPIPNAKDNENDKNGKKKKKKNGEDDEEIDYTESKKGLQILAGKETVVVENMLDGKPVQIDEELKKRIYAEEDAKEEKAKKKKKKEEEEKKKKEEEEEEAKKGKKKGRGKKGKSNKDGEGGDDDEDDDDEGGASGTKGQKSKKAKKSKEGKDNNNNEDGDEDDDEDEDEDEDEYEEVIGEDGQKIRKKVPKAKEGKDGKSKKDNKNGDDQKDGDEEGGAEGEAAGDGKSSPGKKSPKKPSKPAAESGKQNPRNKQFKQNYNDPNANPKFKPDLTKQVIDGDALDENQQGGEGENNGENNGEGSGEKGGKRKGAKSAKGKGKGDSKKGGKKGKNAGGIGGGPSGKSPGKSGLDQNGNRIKDPKYGDAAGNTAGGGGGYAGGPGGAGGPGRHNALTQGNAGNMPGGYNGGPGGYNGGPGGPNGQGGYNGGPNGQGGYGNGPGGYNGGPGGGPNGQGGYYNGPNGQGGYNGGPGGYGGGPNGQGGYGGPNGQGGYNNGPGGYNGGPGGYGGGPGGYGGGPNGQGGYNGGPGGYNGGPGGYGGGPNGQGGPGGYGNGGYNGGPGGFNGGPNGEGGYYNGPNGQGGYNGGPGGYGGGPGGYGGGPDGQGGYGGPNGQGGYYNGPGGYNGGPNGEGGYYNGTNGQGGYGGGPNGQGGYNGGPGGYNGGPGGYGGGPNGQGGYYNGPNGQGGPGGYNGGPNGQGGYNDGQGGYNDGQGGYGPDGKCNRSTSPMGSSTPRRNGRSHRRIKQPNGEYDYSDTPSNESQVFKRRPNSSSSNEILDPIKQRRRRIAELQRKRAQTPTGNKLYHLNHIIHVHLKVSREFPPDIDIRKTVNPPCLVYSPEYLALALGDDEEDESRWDKFKRMCFFSGINDFAHESFRRQKHFMLTNANRIEKSARSNYTLTDPSKTLPVAQVFQTERDPLGSLLSTPKRAQDPNQMSLNSSNLPTLNFNDSLSSRDEPSFGVNFDVKADMMRMQSMSARTNRTTASLYTATPRIESPRSIFPWLNDEMLRPSSARKPKASVRIINPAGKQQYRNLCSIFKKVKRH